MHKMNGGSKLFRQRNSVSSASIDAGEKSSGTRILSILNSSCEPEPVVEVASVISLGENCRRGAWSFVRKLKLI